MQEPASPEEKLLKLIRKKNLPAGPEKLSVQAPASSQGVAASLDGLQFLKWADKILWLAILLFIAVGSYEYLSYSYDVNKVIKETQGPVKNALSEEVVIAQPKPYSYYTAPVAERDIFESPLNKKPEEVKAIAPLPELTKGLRLVGIVLDSSSEAIIEDTEAKQTFFLRKGEYIKDALIEDIKESKVILLYGDQRVELAQ